MRAELVSLEVVLGPFWGIVRYEYSMLGLSADE
jgi:hypothetical protein